MDGSLAGEDGRKQLVQEMTSRLVRGYDGAAARDGVAELLDDPFTCFGTDGQENAGLSGALERGQPERCVSEEKYRVEALSPELYLCTGNVWLCNEDPDRPDRPLQRVTAVFRFKDGRGRCCHLHISTPDMGEREARSSRELREQLAAQKKRIEAQTLLLQQISFKDSLTGMYNRNKFSQDLREGRWEDRPQLGVAYFDLNGLKMVNDRLGHSAGDNLLYRTASHILRVFDQKAYRIGGDEFVVVDDQRDESRFRQAVDTVCESMAQNGISCAVGLSWQAASKNVEEQFNEADHLMYREKRRFYSIQGNDRRNR